MANLIPVKRTDRNGKPVTRWVKVNDSNASSSMPAPKLATSTDAGKEMIRVLQQDFLNNARLIRTQSVSVLDSLDYDTAVKTKNVVDQIETSSSLLLSEMMSMIRGNSEGYREFVGLMDKHFGHAVDEITKGGDSYDAAMMVAGLGYYDFEANDQQQEKLVRVATRLWESDSMDDQAFLDRVFQTPTDQKFQPITVTPLDNELARFVTEHPDRSDEIIHIVTERLITDPKQIKQIMDSSSSRVLGSGAL